MQKEPEFDRDGRLVVPIDGDESTATLANPECLRVVLSKIHSAPVVRGILLVKDRERAFGPRALAAVRSLRDLARLLERLALRKPSPHFPGYAAREIEARCISCKFRPETMFGRLGASLPDPPVFLAMLTDIVSSIEEFREEGCRACVAASIEDHRILIEELARTNGG